MPDIWQDHFGLRSVDSSSWWGHAQDFHIHHILSVAWDHTHIDKTPFQHQLSTSLGHDIITIHLSSSASSHLFSPPASLPVEPD